MMISNGILYWSKQITFGLCSPKKQQMKQLNLKSIVFLAIIIIVPLVVIVIYFHFTLTIRDFTTKSILFNHHPQVLIASMYLSNSEALFDMRFNAHIANNLTLYYPKDKGMLSLMLKQEYSMDIYMKVLYNSIQIIRPTFPSTHKAAINHCKSNWHNKHSLWLHQHSLELRFPYILMEMYNLSTKYASKHYSLLWRNLSDTNRLDNSSDAPFEEPLFYYLETFPYYVVYCTFKHGGKEAWSKLVEYYDELSSSVVYDELYRRNQGVDFLSSASHPKSAPYGVRTAELSYFQRQTFLKCDLDFNGYLPKDIIIPYYVPRTKSATSNRALSSYIQANNKDVFSQLYSSSIRQSIGSNNDSESNVDSSSKPFKYLLFFAGGDNPRNGLRKQYAKSFQEYVELPGRHSALIDRIWFTTDEMGSREYILGMQSSMFCLSMRGDTSSTSRLFSIIEAECIPVIISDWILLPFESLIDYKRFSVQFPESMLNNVSNIVDHLLSITPEQQSSLRYYLKIARTMLIYNTEILHVPSSFSTANGDISTSGRAMRSPLYTESNHYYLYNPVTLSLVEMLIRRKSYCDNLQQVKRYSDMCRKIYDRFKYVLSGKKEKIMLKKKRLRIQQL